MSHLSATSCLSGGTGGGNKVSSIQELLHNERKVVGDQILIGLHDAAEKGLTETIEKIYDRTMDLDIDMRVRGILVLEFCLVILIPILICKFAVSPLL